MDAALNASTNLGDGGVRRPIRPDFSRRVLCIEGLLCDLVTLDEVRQVVVNSIREARRCHIVTPNANFLRLARSDPAFRDAALASDLSIIDGAPLVWLARALGFVVADRTCGSDLCAALMAPSADRFKTFFFGSTRDIGRRVRKRLAASPCGLRCAGVLSPGFGSVESMSQPRFLGIIQRTTPDLLIVSIGARKGLLWLARNEQLLSAPVICNLGASINFIAGTVQRAPAFFRRHGLEWFWRIKEEPALWKRYVLDLATLTTVLIGHVLPCLLERKLRRPSARQLSQARLRHHRRGSTEILEFSGAWTKENLAPVQKSLASATDGSTNLVLDLNRVTFIDAAFLGQILLAYGYQRRMRRSFFLRASASPIRRMLRQHGCGYLLPATDWSAGLALAPAPTGCARQSFRK